MTPLFNLQDIPEEQVQPTTGAFAKPSRAIAELREVPAHKRLEEAFPDFTTLPPHQYFFISHGRWSMHDLLFYLLEHTGPAKVWLTTWALGDKALRLMAEGIEEGLITELNAVFDKRLRVRKAEIMQMATQVVHRMVLLDCHAKMLVVQGQELTLGVMGSANFTNNRRVECGVINTDQEVNWEMILWMEKMLGEGDDL